MTLSNHNPIMLKSFILQLHPEVMKWVFVSYPYLVFVISVLTFKVTVALKFFGSKHILST